MARCKSKKANEMERESFIISTGTDFNVTEAFRNLKASICVSLPKKVNGEGTVLTFTSPNTGEGKTTVAVNIAIMLAMSNAKVLLIDADIRKGRVAKYVGASSAPGLSDYLIGQANKADVVHAYMENLSFIARGVQSPRPYELLESDAMQAFLTELKKEYDSEPALTRYTVCTLGHSQTLDITRAKDILGYKPKVTLDETVKKYAEHYNEHTKN